MITVLAHIAVVVQAILLQALLTHGLALKDVADINTRINQADKLVPGLKQAVQASNEHSRCDEKYSRFSESHTACLLKSPTAKNEGVSEVAKRFIVSLHNRYRANVENKLHKQPAAANMQRMYWDDELANIAQKWASHCYWEHDNAGDRFVPGSYPVGQNLGKGHLNWTSVISHWHSEYKYLKFGDGKIVTGGDRPVGHYTQLVWAESARIGCGYAVCNSSQPLYVCNYAPTGNYLGREFEPYKPGERGSDCPKKVRDGLCDCGGKVCKNGGVLDTNTCICRCPSLAWIGGDDCSINCEKAEDNFMCQSAGGSWGKELCSLYSNVPSEFCPVMCGLCIGKPKVKTSETWKDNIFQSLIGIYGGSDTDSDSAIEVGNGDEDNWLNAILNHKANKLSVTSAAAATSRTTSEPIVSSSPAAGKLTTYKPTSTSVPLPHKLRKDMPGPEQFNRVSPLLTVLPQCTSTEPAQCGQPSADGYYPKSICQTSPIAAGSLCPSLCGHCLAGACQDYSGKRYPIGESWLNEFGTHSCTKNGVHVERGCYLEAVAKVVAGGSIYDYRDKGYHYSCECTRDFSIICTIRWDASLV